MTGIYCNNCGHRNPDGANFCSSCGATLLADEPADSTLSFTIELDGEEEEVAVPLEDLEEGKAVLIVRRGPEAGTRFSIDLDQVACGRDPGSDIFLNDVTVSRRHAQIVRNDSGFEIRDAGSLNGTFVNRQRVERKLLNNGDEIQIGKFRLLFLTGATPAA